MVAPCGSAIPGRSVTSTRTSNADIDPTPGTGTGAVANGRRLPSPAMNAVVAEGLSKRFGTTEALRSVDFEIKRGKVLGLLGPNGAGKTTAVRILCTLL
ncbi:MAG: ATP-binding cassette domain-containing protein, partial [Acidimicrobiales bacterium]